MRVRFTPPTGAVVSGTIDVIDLPDGITADHGYDVAVLRVTDRAFTTAVLELAPPGGVTTMFSASSDCAKAGQTILEIRSRDDARRVVTNGRPFGRLEDPDAENQVLLQFGDGHVSRGANYGFDCGALRINQLANRAFIDATHEGYQDVFVFDTTEANSTTANGDSGGPVFALVPTGVKSFLVGLTLGANFYRDRTDSDPTVRSTTTRSRSSARTRCGGSHDSGASRRRARGHAAGLPSPANYCSSLGRWSSVWRRLTMIVVTQRLTPSASS